MGRRVNRQASRGGMAPGLNEMPLVRGDGLRDDVARTAHPHRLQVPGPDEPAGAKPTATTASSVTVQAEIGGTPRMVLP
jgi:hypothetical protein